MTRAVAQRGPDPFQNRIIKDLKARIEKLKKDFDQTLSGVKDEKSLQEVRNVYMSRKRGAVKHLFEELKTLKPEERAQAGQWVNSLKKHVVAKVSKLRAKLAAPEPGVRAMRGDLTLPGVRGYWGAPHPVVLFQQKIENIFIAMGFSIEEGPEIETDYYNFEALNFPPHHPARDDWDTLYISDDLLLRTHTSPVQIRAMERRKPPIRIIVPGKVYRRETPDPTHLPMFYQVEGLAVDRGITFADLKGTLEHFLKTLFSEKLKIRFRPSFFPFTEPSAEVDIECLVCKGENEQCRVCGGS